MPPCMRAEGHFNTVDIFIFVVFLTPKSNTLEPLFLLWPLTLKCLCKEVVKPDVFFRCCIHHRSSWIHWPACILKQLCHPVPDTTHHPDVTPIIGNCALRVNIDQWMCSGVFQTFLNLQSFLRGLFVFYQCIYIFWVYCTVSYLLLASKCH